MTSKWHCSLPEDYEDYSEDPNWYLRCDTHTEDIPTYSWEESEMQSEDLSAEKPRYSVEHGNSSQPEGHKLIPLPKYPREAETHHHHTHSEDLPKFSVANCDDQNEAVFGEKRGFSVLSGKCYEAENSKSTSEDQRCDLFEDVYNLDSANQNASSPTECIYYDDSQRPESPNLNLDVDAITRELCDGFVDPQPLTQKEKKYYWF